MSLLSSCVQPNPQGYYFGLDGSPSAPQVTAVGFEATGSGVASGFVVTGVSGENFVARAQSTGTTAAFTINNNAGVERWNIGVTGAEAGANAGSEFVINSYNDAGVLIDTPLTIDRSSGISTFSQNVVAPNLLTKRTTFTYDSGGVVVAQPIAAGTTSTNISGTITVPATGIYILSATYGVNVTATDAATFGLADDMGVELVPEPPVMGVLPVSITFRPYSMPNTASGGVDYGAQTSYPVLMTSNVPYRPKYFTDNVSGTMDASGGIAMEMKLVSLC